MSFNNRRSQSGEITSEKVQRKAMYSFVNRINIFARFSKTKEEKEELKRIKSNHTQSLTQYYGKNYNRKKVFNLPQYSYGTITSE